MVGVKRIYDPPDLADGRRVLVDRIWPRGLRKEDAPFDIWLRDIAPSTQLRRWYGHDPERFDEFSRRYQAELHDAAHADAFARLQEYAKAGPVTLLTATRDLDHAHTAVLAKLLAD